MVDYKTMQLATCGGWNPLWLLVIGLCLSMEKPMFKARVAYHNMNYAYRWAYYAAWLKYRELTAAHVPFTPEAVIKATAAAAIGICIREIPNPAQFAPCGRWSFIAFIVSTL